MRLLALLLLGAPLLAQTSRPAKEPRGERPASRPAESVIAPRTLQKKGPDGLTLTADHYLAPRKVKEPAPIVICLHMARSSRGEYAEIAPEFQRRGFSVLAVDLRSGAKRFDVVNETAAAHEELGGYKANYEEAYRDLTTAVNWAKELSPQSKLYMMGSSYSSSLALRYAAQNEGVLEAVLAFSPGNYHDSWRIHEDVAKTKTRTFITWGSSSRERETAQAIVEGVPKSLLTTYQPKEDDKAGHGSTILTGGSEEARMRHWNAVVEFLAPRRKAPLPK